MSKKSKIAIGLIAAVVIVFLAVTFLGGKSYEEQLIGEWYIDPAESRIDEPLFTLYSDGTCSVYMEYGTGHWAVVNENQLKITNIYGQIINFFDGSSNTMTIVELKNNCLTLEDPDQTMQVELYKEEAN